MTRQRDIGVDTKPYTQTITPASDIDDMKQILRRLEAAMEDGYTGVLHSGQTTLTNQAGDPDLCRYQC